jgi:O-antigen/teichoic acid export membrane protein
MHSFFVRFLPQRKLSQDISWTIGSFAFLAMSGVLINIAVSDLRDAKSLGVFNLAYAVYMVASQFAVWGVHYSVLRSTAYYSSSAKKRGFMLGTALMLALLSGLFSAIALFLIAPSLGLLFRSAVTGEAIAFASWGLLLFPVNKVLVAHVNALRQMRAFAVLQALRYLCVMLWVVGVCRSQLPFAWVTLGFFFAEMVTAFASAIYLGLASLTLSLRWSTSWAKRHLAFGSKSLLSGLFAETNSRLDVLLIGLFLDEFSVGVYSFAAMLVDGLYHILAMVRVNVNPILVVTVRDSHWADGMQLLRITRCYGFVATVGLSLGILLIFSILTGYIVPDKGLQGGMLSLVILLAGLSFVSGYIPFDNLLMVTGYPFYQTLQNLSVVLVNALINVFLVPFIGAEGAALATAASYVAGISVLILLANRLIGWNLLTNRVTQPISKQ